MISVLNYGCGNIASIRNMLSKIGAQSCVISTSDEVEKSDALIIPGVGRIDFALSQIEQLGLRQSLNEAALIRKIPILGICLGMQLMTKRSEEGVSPAFGWIDALTEKIKSNNKNIRIPHMGWNVVVVKKNHPIFDISGDSRHRFYFVHSYAVRCMDESDVLSTTNYGCEFTSAFARDNLIGVQFHPEKSHKYGIEFFKRFVGIAAKHA